MRKIIHNLKKQPEDVRRNVLHILTIISALILIILWTFSLGKSFGSPETKVKLKQDLQPFNVLKDSLTVGSENKINP